MEDTLGRPKVNISDDEQMMRLSMSGIMYSETASDCPTGLSDWRYLDSELGWRDNGRISVTCAS